MIVGNGVYSVQNYLDKVTGRCYILDPSIDDDNQFIKSILKRNGKDNLQSYTFKNVEAIANPEKSFVLVDTMRWKEPKESDLGNGGYYVSEPRWYEVPADFGEDDEEN